MQKARSAHPTPLSEPQNVRFKKLYQECKQNASLFVKQVGDQIETILCNHESSKKRLLNEIQQLKRQINHQKVASSSLQLNSSLTSLPTNKLTSHISQPIHTNQISIDNDAGQQYRCRTPRFVKKLSCETRFTQDGLISARKGNRWIKDGFIYGEGNEKFIWKQEIMRVAEKELVQPSKAKGSLSSKRQKRSKQTVQQQNFKHPQDIQDLLKNMRANFRSNSRSKPLRRRAENEEPVLTIITPEMLNESLGRRK